MRRIVAQLQRRATGHQMGQSALACCALPITAGAGPLWSIESAPPTTWGTGRNRERRRSKRELKAERQSVDSEPHPFDRAISRSSARRPRLRSLVIPSCPRHSLIRARPSPSRQKKRPGFIANPGLFSEREKGLEPSTSTLARWHSTTELLP